MRRKLAHGRGRSRLRSPAIMVSALAVAGLGLATTGAAGASAQTHHNSSVAQATHVTDPFSGAQAYLNPDYVSEVKTQASADGSSAEASVANYQTAIWMDHIGAIAGDNGHLGLQAQLNNAETQATSSGQPVLVEVVVYDLPGRDCAALASNGELPATAAGLSEYESSYIDPIASLEGNSSYSNLRIVNIIEPDSVPNIVTNQSISACQTAAPYYEQGIEYALNKLHPITWTYNYMDIGHSGWLGWSSNFSPAIQEYAKIAQATTGGFASVDGFISNTANYIPTVEPYMTSGQSVGGTSINSVQYYSYDPYIEELTYDQAWRSSAISAGFSSNIGMLIDTSRNGWGGPNRPTGPSTSTNATTFVNQSKIDQRPFRGDWCNAENAGIGARPQDNPTSGIQAYVWIKPPGESDGTYPAYSGKGDPHCDPNGTQTDGSGNSYPTDAIPDSPPAGQWFATQFKQLVADAYPALSGSTTGNGNTVTVTSPGNQTGATGSAVSVAVKASDSASGQTLAYSASGLPAGLSINSSTGAITGTPTTAGSYTVTVTATDSTGASGSATFTWTVTGSGGTGPGGTCSVTYATQSQWSGGFTANVTIANTGSSPINNWTLTFTFPGDQQITSAWNGQATQSGENVSIASESFNGTINPAASTSVGFQGTYTNSDAAPTSFAVNGATCTS